jgi:hypothetical protein
LIRFSIKVCSNNILDHGSLAGYQWRALPLTGGSRFRPNWITRSHKSARDQVIDWYSSARASEQIKMIMPAFDSICPFINK